MSLDADAERSTLATLRTTKIIAFISMFLAVAGWAHLLLFLFEQDADHVIRGITKVLGIAVGITLIPFGLGLVFCRRAALIASIGCVLMLAFYALGMSSIAHIKPATPSLPTDSPDSLPRSPPPKSHRIVDAFKISVTPRPFDPITSVPVEDSEEFHQARWPLDLEAFIRTRCELRFNTESYRPMAERHLAIFQQAVNEVYKPGMSNTELLRLAGERAYSMPGYLPRGFCPDDK